MDRNDAVDRQRLKKSMKDNGELLPVMYMVIGVGNESHLAYAIFPTKAKAWRWQLQEGMRSKTQLYKC